jgi:DNA-binding MarR family transcriptional regulator
VTEPVAAGEATGPDLGQYVGYLIRRAAQAHVAAWVREVSVETTSVQFGVLASLSGSQGMSQRDLCDALDLDRSTIADLVARLQRRGLVTRRRDPRDLRTNIVSLTSEGRGECDRLGPRVAEMNRTLIGCLSEVEQAEFARLLTRVLEASSNVPRLRHGDEGE